MTNKEIKEKARFNLGNTIFSNDWLTAALFMFIFMIIYVLSSITIIGSFILFGPLLYCMTKLYLEKSKSNQPMTINDFFIYFGADFKDSFFLGLLFILLTSLWSLLFFIPGIVKAYSYSLCFYLKAEHPEYTCKQCLDISSEMMRGHKKELFLLDLSFIGWFLLSAVTFSLSNFWTLPYLIASRTEYYEALKSKSHFYK